MKINEILKSVGKEIIFTVHDTIAQINEIHDRQIEFIKSEGAKQKSKMREMLYYDCMTDYIIASLEEQDVEYKRT